MILLKTRVVVLHELATIDGLHLLLFAVSWPSPQSLLDDCGDEIALICYPSYSGDLADYIIGVGGETCLPLGA